MLFFELYFFANNILAISLIYFLCYNFYFLSL